MSYLLDDLWGHSNLFTDLHRLSTSALRDRWQIQGLLDVAKKISKLGLFLISVVLAGIKSLSLTAAAGWEAGIAWGATNPAWGLSVARAVKKKLKKSMLTIMCSRFTLLLKLTSSCLQMENQKLLLTHLLLQQWPLWWVERWLCRRHRVGRGRVTALGG